MNISTVDSVPKPKKKKRARKKKSKRRYRFGNPRLKNKHYAQINPVEAGHPLRKLFQVTDSGYMKGAKLLWLEDELGNRIEIHYQPNGMGGADDGEWWIIYDRKRDLPKIGERVDERYEVIGLHQ